MASAAPVRPGLTHGFDATRDYLISRYPGTQDLMSKSVGILYMPLMTEAGFGIGGAFGRGARADQRM